ncbi:uncharacterized protein BJ212DRAFT_1585962 [Suillus subaureus]|uniref:Uncharacterized protein n=1 Tax=Suillus subaureus TaxID=48587 RepID=A0A9P7JGE6_9AGAM|nr:uncharacterized protein BJ212DRAFT_1585962 [Suillus subaureus]KAG1820888.1 hypothetical protein BJ212DRAFT_1585962 [Suillus subaureus]
MPSLPLRTLRSKLIPPRAPVPSPSSIVNKKLVHSPGTQREKTACVWDADADLRVVGVRVGVGALSAFPIHLHTPSSPLLAQPSPIRRSVTPHECAGMQRMVTWKEETGGVHEKAGGCICGGVEDGVWDECIGGVLRVGVGRVDIEGVCGLREQKDGRSTKEMAFAVEGNTAGTHKGRGVSIVSNQGCPPSAGDEVDLGSDAACFCGVGATDAIDGKIVGTVGVTIAGTQGVAIPLAPSISIKNKPYSPSALSS